MDIKGIDISSYQPNIDFIKVKDSGVNFAIIRAGYGTTEDNLFETHYKNAKAVGLNVGAYLYTYAQSVAEAKEEAETFLKWLEGKQFEYPVYFDIEDASLRNLGEELLTDICIAFCSILSASKYYVGIYSNLNWFENKLNLSRLTGYDKWLADWVETPAYGNSFGGLWQYGITQVNGIQYNVDGDISYRDYPATIKERKLNGFSDISHSEDLPITLDINGTTYTGTVHSK